MSNPYRKYFLLSCFVMGFILLTGLINDPVKSLIIKNETFPGKNIALEDGQRSTDFDWLLGVKKAKVAIVIDDFGQSNTEGTKEMFSLNRPLTVAIMPNVEFSISSAETAHQLGHEVIVHLPMEPKKGQASWLGPGAITCQMTPEEIKKKASEDFASVPFAVGFNNHMGSLICAKEDLIRPVLEAAKEKHFFVLDSRTGEDSQVAVQAKYLGIPCIDRDVFLDNVKSVPYIKNQLNLLAEKALDKRSAVAIGHVGQGGRKTAQALREMIPVLEEKGIEFVYLSELIQK
ncbi:divergent polysaccharide deacetylase family protein [Candidatus Formimonas warabiya]|uniref:Divergent polysaccharide deacetylase family protein n=1 Tax=Formimonas warabiya TaxID=1761012 RepID=A0A3G1KQQ5_FORW1|nr:divergent polysaccharide deacetylase family protein [Candidatus Formimonas warabiya]ATW24776.1 hypothetical protein DCMF_08325 [Candidatus Formimonas warabiya]